MAKCLEEREETIWNQLKENVRKELQGHSFNMLMTTVQTKEWQMFREELRNQSLRLLNEINRLNQNYSRIVSEDINSDYQRNMEKREFSFDYFGPCGVIRFIYSYAPDGIILFNRLEEEIFEESQLLF